MKNETIKKRSKIANNVMNYIYKYIDTDINIDELSIDMNVSKFHLHRIFKDEFGKNIYECIKSIRLQKASTLLITNKNSTITDISKMCGYSSPTSFLRAFKKRFDMTPKMWKNGGNKLYSNKVLENLIDISNNEEENFLEIEPTIVKMPEIKGFYIRHQGYDKSIKKTWQKLQTWIYTNEIISFKQIALHHDNPIVTPLDECQYIAMVKCENENLIFENNSLPVLTIPKGIYAKFTFSGKYGDVIKLIKWVYHTWLVNSGYETTTNPSYTIYHKNHFLSEDGIFELDYYLPIKYI